MPWPLSRVFVLAAVLVWLVVAALDIAHGEPIAHELGWVSLGLGLFGVSFLV